MKIPFTKPDITEKEINAVSEVLRSGWITTGPVTKQFEKDLAAYMDVPNVACVNSQTAGAELVLRLLGVGPGDEVIVPAYTYTASCSVIYHVGATPVIIDSQPDSPEMDYDQMEAAITEKTKVIIPVDLGGIICDYQRIYEAVNNKKSLFRVNPDNPYQKIFNRIIVSADTAHSLGAEMDGLKSGNIADFSCFSFHAVKNLTTAEGGAITWRNRHDMDNNQIYKTLMLLSLHGQDKDAFTRLQMISWEYDIVEPWYKCNMSDILAALGKSQLERYPEILAKRHAVINKYNQAFKDLPVKALDHFPYGQRSSGHLYFLRINNFDEQQRNEFISKMSELGVTCNVHYRPLPMFSAYIKRGFDIADYPNAYNYYKNMVTLPLYSTLTDEQTNYIIACVRNLLK